MKSEYIHIIRVSQLSYTMCYFFVSIVYCPVSQETRIIMKADKGNSFVVMDRSEYETKIENLLNDQTTYTMIRKPPFKKVERELNAMLLDLKNTEIIPEKNLSPATFK